MNIPAAAPLTPRPLHGNLASALSQSLQCADNVALFWLGQAGFALVAAGRLLVIDPYLSDSLAEKYRGTNYPHKRMMPPPIQPEELPRLDAVLVTHRHTDHMDPGTLPVLACIFARAHFIVPEAERNEASLRTGLAAGDYRLVGVDAGDVVELGAGLRLTVFPAAHETPETDAAGRHRFLGYGIEMPGLRLWHSGDCVPFSGLVPLVRAFRPDVALLPVNGRNPVLRAASVPGNFTLDEAIATARDVGAAQLIAHHYGMFDFNSCAPEFIDEAACRERAIFVSRAIADVVYDGRADSGRSMGKNNG